MSVVNQIAAILLSARRQTQAGLTADETHGPGGGDETGIVDEVARFFFLYHRVNVFGDFSA